MGLLDIFNTYEGQQGLGLLAAASARSDGAGFGQRLQEGLGMADNWKRKKAQDEFQQMQIAEHMARIEEAKAQRAQQQKMQAMAQQFSTPAIGMAADGYGPSAPASFDRQGYGAALEAIDPIAGLQYQASIQKQAPKLTAYKPGDSVRDENGREMFNVPQEVKPKELPNSVREFEYGTANPEYNKWLMQGKAASAPKTAVDLRDPTAVAKAAMVLQNDYRTATKDSYQRMQAYESMTQAAKDPSAKGDITMVYSFIKALDPTTAVREGEISLVEANRSIPDKVKGYAQKLATGRNLLPEERQDLINQARTLTQTDYKRTRNDVKAYRDNAQRLGLDADLYAPDPYAGFKPTEEMQSDKLSITAPNGKTYSFNSLNELNNFKMKTGVK